MEKQLASLSVSGESPSTTTNTNKVKTVTSGSSSSAQQKPGGGGKQNAENHAVEMTLPPPYHQHQPVVHHHGPHQATPHTKVTGGQPVIASSKQPKQLNFDQPTISSANKVVSAAQPVVVSARPVKGKTGTTPVAKHVESAKSPEFTCTISVIFSFSLVFLLLCIVLL